MIASIIRQPWCIIATDSSQARSFDFTDSTKNVYKTDVDKLHISNGIVFTEGGNPQVFAAFHRRLAMESEAKGGIEGALKKAPTLMNRSARAWEAETKYKHPKANQTFIREARSTYSIIIGWSERRKRILAGTVCDDPSHNSLAPENGYLIQYPVDATKKTVEAYIKGLLFGPTRMPMTHEGAVEAVKKCVRDTAEIEAARLGVKRMAGAIRVVLIDGANPPRVISNDELLG